jgi:3alpha(or 20beta)-hydroxysteroid dehydrogenase
MTKTAAIELGQHGIRVNSIHPGGVNTPMIADIVAARGPSARASDRRVAGAGRIGEASEIASVALFLTCDESSMCTGAEFVADDGSLAGIPQA